jgi:hypothetical protein
MLMKIYSLSWLFLLSLAHVLVCGGLEEQWWWHLPEQCPHQGKVQ